MTLVAFPFSFDKNSSFRATVDVNYEVIPEKLAVRFSMVDDSRKFQQKPAFEDRQRGYASVVWSPKRWNRGSSELKIRASVETGTIEANRPRMIAPVNQFFNVVGTGKFQWVWWGVCWGLPPMG